ncbi:neuromedin-U receptor 2 [Biomphalaria pfeifferi]|uniref:Neuromedin-U receptor 2 n=1 Tax=Biomphalaria pfeifferi TaxID=112525 RepID=A0AAD8F635_BIOPF|nr:neuromedin-U receptor 2 [Biomphalaria pfeifferi]
MNNTTLTDYPATQIIDQYVTPVIVIIGLPGNILSLIIWMQKRMRHSSGYYLAALALDDLIFLLLSIVFEIHNTWHIKILDVPVLCEAFPVVFLPTQYLSPFFVLAFTTERYISICHPFKREKYCTIKRAKIVIISLVVFVLCLCSPMGYFFTMAEDCTLRKTVLDGYPKSVYNIYTLTMDLFCFFLVPMTVLVMNILVIVELRRLTRMESAQLHGSPQRTAATTVTLLAVSFYQIFTTLPVSIVYTLFMEFVVEDGETDPIVYKRHYTYNLVMAIIKEYGITHYAFNFLIYIITGKMFRQELRRLLLRPFSKLGLTLTRDYTSLTGSTRVANESSRKWVSTNGNHKEPKSVADETLL